ncbi:putative cystathionine beta-synthase [Clavispora lusitaniae]|uniref:CBS domain-containing protein n=2 Tax=Clavispora lusitaniae TaxID=36911 RepID=C4YCJ0_CLAL4|nr:uncharacterized protein CLUG_05829 [Clavispora lusitaniae ATCC 42720]KAF5208665.1 hypothetical protein E0198_005171 [Clavispora lusitaniae]EEQ41701.1 hypothetical protein CLUG_05829 [Clavispora lusitaniae ATCC 42720]QFZ30392.1 putative cystathionine beta-synthase [Clavispora lusitaniae]QFZ36054.1 putative cystathionine beta-synthase [Clavispora lusitaniae]QFZ41738.1 putative cystathionine beta-synthase [Clavispora lusitaniae]
MLSAFHFRNHMALYVVACTGYFFPMNPTLFHTVDYRGATVEDLDIRPAISINPGTSIDRAIHVAFENEFSFLPVIHEAHKTLLGVLNVEEAKRAPPKDITKNHMLWFSQRARSNYEKESKTHEKTPVNSKIFRPSSRKYHVLTPLTSLEELAAFFNDGNYFAIITNGDGNLVYGVVTPEDLLKYEHSRPRL